VEHLEALVFDFLLSVPLDILLQEFKSGLVGGYRVFEIVRVVVDVLGLSEEGANGFAAGLGLHILEIYSFLEPLVEILGRRCGSEPELLENSHQDCSESLEVPVLVNDLVDDSGLENLGYLLGK
jgi:hypothetical protein